MFDLTFIRAANGVPLSKTFKAGGHTSAYPNVRNLNSKLINIDDEADWLTEMTRELRYYATNGWAMMKGPFVKTLNAESRADQSDKKRGTRLLVIDADNLSLPSWAPENHYTENTLLDMAEEFLRYMPEFLRDSGYIINASASQGIKKGMNFHLFFLLDGEMDPFEQKNFLRLLNFHSTSIEQQLTLTGSGTALSYPIDIVTADNSRIIFIAPPKFNDNRTDPVPERFTYREKDELYIKIKDIRAYMRGTEKAHVKVKNKVAGLRESLGLPPKNEQTYNLTDFEGRRQRVVINPDQIKLIRVEENDQYVRFNINNGDSNAYWVHKKDPRIVHNFKNEPRFLYEQADPEGYKQFCEEFGVGNFAIQTAPMPFVDMNEDKVKFIIADIVSREIVEPARTTSRASLPDIMASYGENVPDILHVAEYKFEPHDYRQVDLDNRFVNSFSMPPLLKEPVAIDETFHACPYEYSGKALEKLCPHIHNILTSITGNDPAGYHHFVNWLAFIIQRLDKTGTAWLFHGAEGTGKGRFFENVLQEILTVKYTQKLNQEGMDDSFTGWQEGKFLIAGDEIKYGNNKTDRSQLDKIKNAITEEQTSVRAMRTENKNIRSYSNWMFFTNNRDALPISDTDRRFNICNRQEVPLIKQFPQYEMADNLPILLIQEAPRFATFLLTFDLDPTAAHKALETEAKIELGESSRSEEESVAALLKNGYIDPYLEFLDLGTDIDNPAHSRAISMIKVAALHIDPKTGKLSEKLRRTYLTHTLSDIYDLYIALSNNIGISKHKFSKRLRSYGGHCHTQKGLLLSRTQPTYKAGTIGGFRIHWQVKNKDRLASYHQQLVHEFCASGGPPDWLQRLLDMGHVNYKPLLEHDDDEE